MNKRSVILGAGITGLSAGISTRWPVYEANSIPGGICASYYMDTGNHKYYSSVKEQLYRFEVGGGHWIFGAKGKTFRFIESLSPTKRYVRGSAVYLPRLDLYIPYPLQNHLYYLPGDIRTKALKQILHKKKRTASTLAGWLEANFGKTLCELFFFPFHQLYTAGLYKKIAPQDQFKTPIDKRLILIGSKEKTPSVGYNNTFIYPKKGLDDLMWRMAGRSQVYYDKKVIRIDLKRKKVAFVDGSSVVYDKIVSTLPLDKMIRMTGIELASEPFPYTSVLVVNIGAIKGEKCPAYHWIYTPESKSGFHRIGFYSNVDDSFLPLSARRKRDKVSIYVEKTYQQGKKPDSEETRTVCNGIIQELQDWGFIKGLEVLDSTWVEAAYTWQYPGSNWREEALKLLEANQIYQIGRYGRWRFQGIAESIKDGMRAVIS